MTDRTRIAFIGFGEAAQAFCAGWGDNRPRIAAYDRKTDDPATRPGKRDDFACHGVTGVEDCAAALAGADLAISVVTADQALAAATAAAPHLPADALYADCNSVAPDTKRRAAAIVEAAGGRYLDVAVMAPVRPALLAVPMLVAGPHAAAGVDRLTTVGFNARAVGAQIGDASAIKMIRSIMIKGVEALTAECVLSAYAAGVQDEVFASLDASFPDWDWRARADYNLDRMLVHGPRRAEEMKEARVTAERLGQTGAMAAATVAWQQRLGTLSLVPPPAYLDAKVDAILRATGATS